MIDVQPIFQARVAALAPFVKTCPDCGQPILWPFTNASAGVNLMPVDAAPVNNGNVLITVDEANPKRITCDVVAAKPTLRRLASGGWPLFRHHRITCTRAEKWARPQRRAVPAVSTAGDLREVEGLF